MAVFATTRPVAHGFLFEGRITSIVMNSAHSLIAWNDARVTRKALSKLTDRELDDIGLCRGDIDSLSM